jgi:ElaB/YqjD/DUF883 family membrane-anchored ribosome-binding protein/uncharacterized protein YjbJ (UPF0337 family)
MTSQQDRRLDRLSTSREYQAEAEQTRQRLADNLDQLTDRLTPGQVFDEMLTYSRAGGGTFARALTNAMRENPLPSFLIGAGCMLFLSDKMGVRAGSFGGAFRSPPQAPGYDPYVEHGRARASVYGARDAVVGASGRVSDAAGRVSEAAGRMTNSAASTARDTAASLQAGVQGTSRMAMDQASGAATAVTGAASSVSGAVRQTAGAVGDAVSGATGAVGDAVRRTAGAATDTLSGATDAVRATTHDLRDRTYDAVGTMRDAASSAGGRVVDRADRTRVAAMDAVRSGRETATSFIAEQPLLSAAIGVAVGAAIASLWPATETEDQLMGDASDRVKGAAGQAASDSLDGARNVASKVVERAQSAAREEGFSPSAVAEAARNVGEGFHQGVSPAQTTGSAAQEDFSSSSVTDAALDLGEGVHKGLPAEPTTGSAHQELTDVRRTGP